VGARIVTQLVGSTDAAAARTSVGGGSFGLAILVCFALNMVDGMDILVLSYIAPALQREWRVGPGELSIAFSAGLAGMAVGGLLLAPLADRFGRRRLLLFAVLLMSTAMLASSQVQSVVQLAAVRILVGCGIGTVLACIAATAARAAPDEKRSFAVGVLQAGYPIGAMITGFVTAWALPQFGWRPVLVGTAVVSVPFVPFILLLLPSHAPEPAARGRGGVHALLAEGRLASSLLLWSATICGFMALYFIASWITKLSIEAGLAEGKAIVASAIYNFGAFAGTVGMSLMSARVDVRKLCCVLLVATAGVFLVFGGVRMPLPGVLATALVMGVVLQGGVNALYPIAARIYPEAVRATGIGWSTGVGRIGAFLGPMVGGAALDLHLPLVAVFGVFCVPLCVAAAAARFIRFADA